MPRVFAFVAALVTAFAANAQDTSRATPAGTTFTAPSAWQVAPGDKSVTLQAPEGDLRVAIVDVGAAAGADDAVAAGWTAYKADAKPPLKVALPLAARNGWDERRSYQYETSPNERRTVFALAWRAGSAWTAVVVDSSDATLEKRGSQLSLVLNSLRPAGYQRESFAGKKANALTPERTLSTRRNGGVTLFDVSEWRSSVASRRNDDGAMSFVTIDPTLAVFEFTMGERDGKRTLVLRDAQHEYVFKEP